MAGRRAAVREALEAAADPARAAAARDGAPTALEVLGVPVPAIRETVKRHLRELRTAPAEEVVALARALLAESCLESRQVAYELVGGHRGAMACLAPEFVEELGSGIDNWRSVDVFATEVAGPAWRTGRLGDETIHRWLGSDDPWWRRAALVSTFSLNARSRGGRGDVARTLRVCERAVDDRHDLVVKALSWAVREVIPWDPTAVEGFLDAHRARLHPRVVREVRSKLETGLKR